MTSTGFELDQLAYGISWPVRALAAVARLVDPWLSNPVARRAVKASVDFWCAATAVVVAVAVGEGIATFGVTQTVALTLLVGLPLVGGRRQAAETSVGRGCGVPASGAHRRGGRARPLDRPRARERRRTGGGAHRIPGRRPRQDRRLALRRAGPRTGAGCPRRRGATRRAGSDRRDALGQRRRGAGPRPAPRERGHPRPGHRRHRPLRAGARRPPAGHRHARGTARHTASDAEVPGHGGRDTAGARDRRSGLRRIAA